MYLTERCQECANTKCSQKIYTFVPLAKDRVFCPRYVAPCRLLQNDSEAKSSEEKKKEKQ